jgi:general secretion pathway protein F
MPAHVVRYLDLNQNVVQQRRVDALTADEARASVQADGAIVLDVQSAVINLWPAWFTRQPSNVLKPAEVSLLCRELRALLGAGLSVVEALDALDASNQRVNSIVSPHAALLGKLREGRSLSSAMKDVEGFPPLLIASVQSSERTSNLIEALDAYLHYDEMVGTLRRRVVSASLYPAIVVALGLLVAVFLLMVVIPRFASLYGEMGSGAGAATRSLLQISLFLREYPWAVPAGIVLLIVVLGVVVQGGLWRRLLLWVLYEIPWLARRVGHFERARVFEALALLVKGGYSLHEAIGMSIGVSGGPEGAARLQQAGQAIERGTAVAPAFAAAGLTDPVTERLLRAGDRGGQFERVLKAISQRHAREFETFVERATRIVEPTLLLGVALLVGGMVILLYMPIFDIAGSVR